MGIEILPPDINEGEGTFTAASDSSIRYGLSAIKSLGRPVIEAIVEERANGGRFILYQGFREKKLINEPWKVLSNRERLTASD